MRNDYRNYLFESFVKTLKEFNPKIFLFENVPGILNAAPGNIPITERIYLSFMSAQYQILPPEELKKYAVLNSVDFGVPQNRKRVFIIGIKIKKNNENNINLLYDIYNKLLSIKISSENIKTVRDTIFDMPKFYPLDKSIKKNRKTISHMCKSQNKLNDHIPRFHNQHDINVFKKWINENLNNMSNRNKLDFYNQTKNKTSNHIKYRSLVWDNPSPTIVAHLYKDGLMFIHPDSNQARSITIREAARLQSFSDDFEFIGSNSAKYKMIGNAVPPLMAKKIAEILYKYL
jgi:DNA (cytosine-5)-methyltransferase 1